MWRKDSILLEEISEAIERCWSLQSCKKVMQFPGSSRESVGGSEELGEWMVLGGGRWSQALVSLYAFWQVLFQECVNDSYDVWSPFHYIPCSHQYIHTLNAECETGVLSLCLCSVWKHRLLSVWTQLHLLGNSFIFLWFMTIIRPQYSTLKEGKNTINKYIHTHTYIHYMVSLCGIPEVYSLY